MGNDENALFKYILDIQHPTCDRIDLKPTFLILFSTYAWKQPTERMNVLWQPYRKNIDNIEKCRHKGLKDDCIEIGAPICETYESSSSSIEFKML